MLRIVSMAERAARRSLSPERRRWLRHQANNIVAQLPENEDEALYVLEHAQRLIVEYMRDDPADLRSVGEN